MNSHAEEDLKGFVRRKADHISQSLNEKNQALGLAGLDRIQLLHESLPELDFADVDLSCNTLGISQKTPFLISSMTAGHDQAGALNLLLARASAKRGWLMGVGSQRRQLFDESAKKEWEEIRRLCPEVNLLGNIGLSQLIYAKSDEIKALADSLQARAMIVHSNPLQECIQDEGTPHFKGGLNALEDLVRDLQIPVVLKETGCGFSRSTLQKLKETGLAAIDVSGLGGTHWGRIEGSRSGVSSSSQKSAKTFANWGVSTLESLLGALELAAAKEIWASGGLRTGLDAAKCLAIGANVVGFAKPILQGALDGEETLDQLMSDLERDLRIAMFCTGCANLKELQQKSVWTWTKN